MKELIQTIDPKIDNFAINGLSGVTDSLAYKVHEIERHLHNREYCYGNSSNIMTEEIPVVFTVTGGDNAWGTEILLQDGTVIQSGSSTKKWDLDRMYINAVDTANKITIVQYRAGTKGTPLTSVTTTDVGDLFTKVDHGLSNGNIIILSSIVGTTGINTYTVYYIVGVSGNDFQVSLTSGGAAVLLTTDGSCTVTPLTMETITCSPVSMAAVNNDATPYELKGSRYTCNKTLSIRGKTESGSTVAISFLLGLHIYDA